MAELTSIILLFSVLFRESSLLISNKVLMLSACPTVSTSLTIRVVKQFYTALHSSSLQPYTALKNPLQSCMATHSPLQPYTWKGKRMGTCHTIPILETHNILNLNINPMVYTRLWLTKSWFPYDHNERKVQRPQ